MQSEAVPLAPERLLAAVGRGTIGTHEQLASETKSTRAIAAKEILILTGRRLGATATELARITNLNTFTISRRHDHASNNPHRNGLANAAARNYETERIGILSF